MTPKEKANNYLKVFGLDIIIDNPNCFIAKAIDIALKEQAKEFIKRLKKEEKDWDDTNIFMLGDMDIKGVIKKGLQNIERELKQKYEVE